MEAIVTENAAVPLGPYSQAIRAHPFIFVSGQVPSTPGRAGQVQSLPTTSSASAHTIGTLTQLCIDNLKAILEAGGSSLEKVVRVGVFLTNMEDFKEMNEVYMRNISHKPARTCIAVKELPFGVPVEIEAVALL